jgi:hypothetical protein
MLCQYAECRLLFIIMLNAIILSEIMLNVVMLSVVEQEPTLNEEPLRVPTLTTGLTRKY